MKSIFFSLFTILIVSTLEAREASRPNILMIVADDHGYGDLSAHPGAAKDVATPNIDRIAEAGMLFADGYASSPICSPSRVGIATGVHQQRMDNWWYGGKGLADSQHPTIAELLRANGYATAMIGKVHFDDRFFFL